MGLYSIGMGLHVYSIGMGLYSIGMGLHVYSIGMGLYSIGMGLHVMYIVLEWGYMYIVLEWGYIVLEWGAIWNGNCLYVSLLLQSCNYLVLCNCTV